MAVYLNVSKSNLEHEHTSKLHYIPASIEGNSEANVSQYFEQFTEETENGFYTNSLRGFPLTGCTLQVPDGYKGVIFHETQKPLTEETDRNFKVNGIFDKFTYWNWNRNPSNNDPLKQAMDWLDIAKTLHATEDDFESDENNETDDEKQTNN